jgi:hypothetical protein
MGFLNAKRTFKSFKCTSKEPLSTPLTEVGLDFSPMLTDRVLDPNIGVKTSMKQNNNNCSIKILKLIIQPKG